MERALKRDEELSRQAGALMTADASDIIEDRIGCRRFERSLSEETSDNDI